MIKPILLICGSMKPPLNKKTPSATRELLKIVQQGIHKAGGSTQFVDLRDMLLPFFDGREKISEYKNKDLLAIYKVIHKSDMIVISIPAYWGGPSGVVKNLIDLLGGPRYRKNTEVSPLKGKIIGFMIVGDTEESAQSASVFIQNAINSQGGLALSNSIVIGNPHGVKNLNDLMQKFYMYGKSLWLIAQKAKTI
jgi:multimeric flavodoxin WrbA